MGVAVAALAAMHRNDVDGAVAVIQTVEDPYALVATIGGMLAKIGPIAAGSPERWAEMLAAWRPGMRLGDDD